MFLHHPSFTNRPDVDATFLPINFNLNSLRTSGWYAPLGALKNAPDNFTLYQLFVVAPNPDVYATQMAFGVAYKVISPHEEAGDVVIVEDEILKDSNGYMVYTNKRLAVDVNGDGSVDTDVGSLHINVGGEDYNVLRLVTNSTYDPTETHRAYNDSEFAMDVNGDGSIDTETGTMAIDIGGEHFLGFRVVPDSMDVSSLEHKENLPAVTLSTTMTTKGQVQANAIFDDQPDIVVTNRSAIYVRSYINGSWTSWNTFGAVSSAQASTSTSTEQSSSDLINSGELAANFEKIYSYIDNKLTFVSSMPGTEVYGLQVEVTGSYNEAPYDPSYNVYGVQASGIEYNGLGDFPETGDPQKLYIAKNENRLYRWDSDSSSYWCVGSNWEDIFIINSGTSENLLEERQDENLDDPEVDPDDFIPNTEAGTGTGTDNGTSTGTDTGSGTNTDTETNIEANTETGTGTDTSTDNNTNNNSNNDANNG